MCWKKWWEVLDSMYAKVLHSPTIKFYLNFYSKELLNLYLTTAINRENQLKLHLKYIFQAYLWYLRRFCEDIIEYFEAPNWICIWFYNFVAAINYWSIAYSELLLFSSNGGFIFSWDVPQASLAYTGKT